MSAAIALQIAEKSLIWPRLADAEIVCTQGQRGVLSRTVRLRSAVVAPLFQPLASPPLGVSRVVGSSMVVAVSVPAGRGDHSRCRGVACSHQLMVWPSVAICSRRWATSSVCVPPPPDQQNFHSSRAAR